MFDGAAGAEAVDAVVDLAEDVDSGDSDDQTDREVAAAAVIPASDRTEIYFIDPSVDQC